MMKRSVECGFCAVKMKQYKNVTDHHIDMIEIVLPDFQPIIYKDSKICITCDSLLVDIFNFKSSCLELEDNIHNYKTDSMIQIDLEKIIGLTDIDNNGTSRICRTCFKIIDDELYVLVCTSKNTLLVQHQQKCLPELDLMLTKQPVVCIDCVEMIQKYFNFSTGCLKNLQNVFDLEKTTKNNGSNEITVSSLTKDLKNHVFKFKEIHTQEDNQIKNEKEYIKEEKDNYSIRIQNQNVEKMCLVSETSGESTDGENARNAIRTRNKQNNIKAPGSQILKTSVSSTCQSAMNNNAENNNKKQDTTCIISGLNDQHTLTNTTDQNETCIEPENGSIVQNSIGINSTILINNDRPLANTDSSLECTILYDIDDVSRDNDNSAASDNDAAPFDHNHNATLGNNDAQLDADFNEILDNDDAQSDNDNIVILDDDDNNAILDNDVKPLDDTVLIEDEKTLVDNVTTKPSSVLLETNQTKDKLDKVIDVDLQKPVRKNRYKRKLRSHKPSDDSSSFDDNDSDFNPSAEMEADESFNEDYEFGKGTKRLLKCRYCRHRDTTTGRLEKHMSICRSRLIDETTKQTNVWQELFQLREQAKSLRAARQNKNHKENGSVIINPTVLSDNPILNTLLTDVDMPVDSRTDSNLKSFLVGDNKLVSSTEKLTKPDQNKIVNKVMPDSKSVLSLSRLETNMIGELAIARTRKKTRHKQPQTSSNKSTEPNVNPNAQLMLLAQNNSSSSRPIYILMSNATNPLLKVPINGISLVGNLQYTYIPFQQESNRTPFTPSLRNTSTLSSNVEKEKVGPEHVSTQNPKNSSKRIKNTSTATVPTDISSIITTISDDDEPVEDTTDLLSSNLVYVDELADREPEIDGPQVDVDPLSLDFSVDKILTGLNRCHKNPNIQRKETEEVINIDDGDSDNIQIGDYETEVSRKKSKNDIADAVIEKAQQKNYTHSVSVLETNPTLNRNAEMVASKGLDSDQQSAKKRVDGRLQNICNSNTKKCPNHEEAEKPSKTHTEHMQTDSDSGRSTLAEDSEINSVIAELEEVLAHHSTSTNAKNTKVIDNLINEKTQEGKLVNSTLGINNSLSDNCSRFGPDNSETLPNNVPEHQSNISDNAMNHSEISPNSASTVNIGDVRFELTVSDRLETNTRKSSNNENREGIVNDSESLADTHDPKTLIVSKLSVTAMDVDSDLNNDSVNNSEDKNSSEGSSDDSQKQNSTVELAVSTNTAVSATIELSDSDSESVIKNLNNPPACTNTKGTTKKDTYYKILNDHMIYHNILSIFKCDWCPFNTRYFHIVEGHVLTHFFQFVKKKKYVCNECPNEFSTKYRLFEHFKNVHQRLCYRLCFWCVNCAKTFGKKIDIRKHFRVCPRRHITVKLFKSNQVIYCMLCNYETTSLDKAKTHTLSCMTRNMKCMETVQLD